MLAPPNRRGKHSHKRSFAISGDFEFLKDPGLAPPPVLTPPLEDPHIPLNQPRFFVSQDSHLVDNVPDAIIDLDNAMQSSSKFKLGHRRTDSAPEFDLKPNFFEVKSSQSSVLFEEDEEELLSEHKNSSSSSINSFKPTKPKLRFQNYYRSPVTRGSSSPAPSPSRFKYESQIYDVELPGKDPQEEIHRAVSEIPAKDIEPPKLDMPTLITVEPPSPVKSVKIESKPLPVKSLLHDSKGFNRSVSTEPAKETNETRPSRSHTRSKSLLPGREVTIMEKPITLEKRGTHNVSKSIDYRSLSDSAAQKPKKKLRFPFNWLLRHR